MCCGSVRLTLPLRIDHVYTGIRLHYMDEEVPVLNRQFFVFFWLQGTNEKHKRHKNRP